MERTDTPIEQRRKTANAMITLDLLLHFLEADLDDREDRIGSAGDFTPHT